MTRAMRRAITLWMAAGSAEVGAPVTGGIGRCLPICAMLVGSAQIPPGRREPAHIAFTTFTVWPMANADHRAICDGPAKRAEAISMTRRGPPLDHGKARRWDPQA